LSYNSRLEKKKERGKDFANQIFLRKEEYLGRKKVSRVKMNVEKKRGGLFWRRGGRSFRLRGEKEQCIKKKGKEGRGRASVHCARQERRETAHRTGKKGGILYLLLWQTRVGTREVVLEKKSFFYLSSGRREGRLTSYFNIFFELDCSVG